MKLYSTLINVIILLFCMSFVGIAQQKTPAVKCIVIDAGHGGKDPGAVNGKLFEKNITLSVALKLGRLINTQYPDIKVVYTRKDDTFVTLQNRGNIANKANADLFISIHTNAAVNTTAKGTETYLLGADRNGDNLAVAMRENDVILYEDDYSTRYQGYEPGSSESYIIFSLMNYAYQTLSLSMANYVQKEFGAGLPMKNRGVKQAGYLVLRNTAMPAILTEIGFISNSEESKYIGSEEGQKKIARLLMNATDSYIKEVGKTATNSVKAETTTNRPDGDQENSQFDNKDITYRVLALESKSRTPINSMNFGVFVSVTEEVKATNSYKYYIERVFSYKEALLLHQKIQSIIPGATLVAFRGERLIPLEEAKKNKP